MEPLLPEIPTATVSVPLTELIEVDDRVSPFVGGDEREGQGHLLLRSGDGVRRWTATDGARLAWMEFPDVDAPRVTLLVAPRAVSAAVRLSGDDSSATVDLVEDKTHLTVRGTLGETVVPRGTDPFPDVEDLVRRSLDQPYVHVDVDRERLIRVVATARHAPAGALDTDRPNPLFWLDVAPGADLTITTDWHEFGVSRYRVPCRADGAVRLPVGPMFLAELLDATRDDSLSISLPADRRGPVIVATSDWTGYLMPIDVTAESTRPALERYLAVRFGSVPARDADGDYVISHGSWELYVRLVEADPARIDVFAVALRDVDSTLELLTEINSINVGRAFSRVVWSNQHVLVTAELMARSLDQAELYAAIDNVADVAAGIGPTLAVVFGGASPFAG